MDLNIADLWGKPDLGDDFRKPLKTNIRTLFISGTMDSNTPTEQTEEIRKDFSNSSHLILQYGGHEDSLPHQEVQKAIVEFLNGQNIGNRTINQPKPKFKPIP
jgi:pimeloyl-ACP methyl ester carboxylesterase